MYVGNRTAPVKGTFDHNGTWENIAGYKFVGLLERSTEMPRALLVLCPLSLMDGWATDFSKFCPRLRVLSYVGDKERRM